MLTTDKDKFETEYCLPYNQKHKSEWFKHILVDSILGVMVEQRIALSMLFYAWWSPETELLTSEEEQSPDSIKIIEVVIDVLLMSP